MKGLFVNSSIAYNLYHT